MSGAGRLGDQAQGQSDAHGCPGCPHPVVGPAIAGSPDVYINGRPSLRVDDVGIHAACCGTNMWQATAGSATVFVNGKPLARLNDATRHCGGPGKLVQGSDDVVVGGASSSAGSASGGSSGSGAGSSGGGGPAAAVAASAGSAPAAPPKAAATPKAAAAPKPAASAPAAAPQAGAAAVAAVKEKLDAAHLKEAATTDETDFKRRVYRRHCQLASRDRPFCSGVPASELIPVEHKQTMRRAAGEAAIALMQALRAALTSAQSGGDEHAGRVKDVHISSGYRDPVHDRDVWEQYYPKYYGETKSDREATGDAHGEASVDLLARFIRHYKAAPGYSNHTNGFAFDIVTTEVATQSKPALKMKSGEPFGFTTDHRHNQVWETTWVYQWLAANAHTWGFHRIATEAWHWEHPSSA